MPEEARDFQKRMPSVERKVSEIKQDDIRVSIIGTVIDNQDNRVVVDDGTGKVSVSFEAPVKAENNKLVRVLGRVIPMEGGVELQGDALQDMSGMDMGLKKSADELGELEKAS